MALTEICPTTRLDAINQMLADIGDRPVNSIDDTTRQDVSRAITALDRTSRMVQAQGWWFGVEEFTVVPTSLPDGFLNLPGNVINVDLRDRDRFSDQFLDAVRYVQRGQRLYDITNRTFTGFTANVEVKGTFLLDFEEMPEVARNYIFTEASVIFQAQTVGSQIIKQYTQEQARAARTSLDREQLRQDDSVSTTWRRFVTLMHNR